MKKINNPSCSPITTVVNDRPERVIGNASNRTSDWLAGNVTMAPTSTEATSRNCSLANENDDLQCWETMIGQVSVTYDEYLHILHLQTLVQSGRRRNIISIHTLLLRDFIVSHTHTPYFQVLKINLIMK